MCLNIVALSTDLFYVEKRKIHKMLVGGRGIVLSAELHSFWP